MKTYLVLDCGFLCRRAFHTASRSMLEHDGIKTGVIYGFLQDVQNLCDQFDTKRVVFCFDVGYNKRKNILKTYKEGRVNENSEELSEEEVAQFKELKRQVKKLRKVYLPSMGYRNILWHKGYEADDVIASFVKRLPAEDLAVIVSADKDFRQLVCGNVMQYDPSRMKRTTLQSFKKEFGIEPKRWAEVLAISGCRTDKVPGIPKIGDITALKYLRGELKETSAAYKAITSPKGVRRAAFNSKLVYLPLHGVKKFPVKKDDEINWEPVLKKLGMRSLLNPAPRRRSRGKPVRKGLLG